jgi:hypothetical protein
MTLLLQEFDFYLSLLYFLLEIENLVDASVSLHAIVDEIFQLLPFVLLEILQTFEAVQEDVLAAMLQTVPFGAFDVAIYAQSVLFDLLDLLDNLFIGDLLRHLIYNDCVLVIVLYLSKGLKHKPIERFLVALGQVDSHCVIFFFGVLLDGLVSFGEFALDEVHQEMLLKGLEIESGSVGQVLCDVLMGSAFSSGLLVDGMTDGNEGAVIDFEEVVLQLVLDILDQKLIPLFSQFLLELLLLLFIDDGDEHLVDKPQIVAAHQDVFSVVDGLGEGLQQGAGLGLLFEEFEGLHEGEVGLHFPGVVLEHG